MSQPSRFEQLLIEALNLVDTKEVEAFFEEKFLKGINTQLDSNLEVPAETFRQQRIQTKKIQTYFLTLKKK